MLTQKDDDLEFMDEVLNKGIPMVAICRTVFLDVPNVTTDEAGAMEKAMDCLLENGHRKIGIIEGNSNLDSTRLRHRGWRASMTKHGLDPDSLPVEHGTYRYASGYQAAKRLLEQDLTAILSFNDEMAFGAREAVTEVGLKVPDEVEDLSGYANMKLTTVERNMGEIAREGTRILLRRLEDGIIDNRRVYLENRLIIRETVKNLNA